MVKYDWNTFSNSLNKFVQLNICTKWRWDNTENVKSVIIGQLVEAMINT